MEAVRKFPRLSTYELVGVLKWTIGGVHGTAKRLHNSNQRYIRLTIRDGRRADLRTCTAYGGRTTHSFMNRSETCSVFDPCIGFFWFCTMS